MTATTAPPKIYTEIIEITPSMADKWMERNPSNRPLREYHINGLVRDIKAGHFVLNGESIKFAPNGDLLDGQHRLSAISLAGKAVKSVVAYNVDPASMRTIDTGKKRSYADVLHMRGEYDPKTLAAVLRRIYLWEAGIVGSSGGQIMPTPDELTDLFTQNPSIRESAEIASKLGTRSMLPNSIVGLTHYLFSQDDRDKATWFMTKVYDGDGLSFGDPIYALRKRIMDMRISGGRVNETEALALTILAWNAARKGKKLARLQLPKGGLTASNFPRPVQPRR